MLVEFVLLSGMLVVVLDRRSASMELRLLPLLVVYVDVHADVRVAVVSETAKEVFVRFAIVKAFGMLICTARRQVYPSACRLVAMPPSSVQTSHRLRLDPYSMPRQRLPKFWHKTLQSSIESTLS